MDYGGIARFVPFVDYIYIFILGAKKGRPNRGKSLSDNCNLTPLGGIAGRTKAGSHGWSQIQGRHVRITVANGSSI